MTPQDNQSAANMEPSGEMSKLLEREQAMSMVTRGRDASGPRVWCLSVVGRTGVCERASRRRSRPGLRNGQTVHTAPPVRLPPSPLQNGTFRRVESSGKAKAQTSVPRK